jgi:hypothetical protein
MLSQTLNAYKYEYRPTGTMRFDKSLNVRLPLTKEKSASSLKDTPLLREKIEQLAAFIFSTVQKVMRPLERPFCWLKHKFCCFGFWLVYPKSVSFSLIREIYTFAIPLVETLPQFSQTALIEALVEQDELFKTRARLLATTLKELKASKEQASSPRSMPILSQCPDEHEIRRIFQCQLIATHMAHHLTDQANCKLRIVDNAQLVTQMLGSPIDDLKRIDALTLIVMQKSGLNSDNYVRLLYCLLSANIGTSHHDSPFTPIYTQIQSCLSLYQLDARLARLQSRNPNYDEWAEACVYLCHMAPCPETQEEVDAARSPLFKALPLIPSPTYSAIRDIVNRIFKEFIRLYNCVIWAIPCEGWRLSTTSWSLRLSNFVNSFFELDREQRQRQLFQNYILSVASKVPELLDAAWMEKAQKHAGSWQSLAYMLESYQKLKTRGLHSPNITYEDFFFTFVVHHYCQYRYKAGLHEAYDYLAQHLPPERIESEWLQNTTSARLHFSDTHTLRMLTRLQKNPQALVEILILLNEDKGIPHERETFNRCFECTALYDRLHSIHTTSLGITEMSPPATTLSHHSSLRSLSPQNYELTDLI